MGEANIRRENDPMYGVIPKKGAAPSWVVHRGVLVLVPVKGRTLTFLPANNMLVLDEGAMAILDAHIDANPYLLPASPEEVSGAAQRLIDIDNAYMESNGEDDVWEDIPDDFDSAVEDDEIESDTTQQE